MIEALENRLPTHKKDPTVISIGSLWIGAVIWITLSIVSFLTGWVDLRGMIHGSLDVLTFTACAYLIARTS